MTDDVSSEYPGSCAACGKPLSTEKVDIGGGLLREDFLTLATPERPFGAVDPSGTIEDWSAPGVETRVCDDECKEDYERGRTRKLT